ncbi:PREDICTED: 39S ribosomal protein L4, mitochondrial-like [Priapulus caudatus]|uniref:Large ribosomal subunit protein uL4m n=1 Tax=Priapulus caudatus TaxID=37621 RepID=A0ABM1EN56_PRICU|nr:PREDICTED: 39S ribosomal protein L4, mitochondrial-like [Priapulus caudatus]
MLLTGAVRASRNRLPSLIANLKKRHIKTSCALQDMEDTHMHTHDAAVIQGDPVVRPPRVLPLVTSRTLQFPNPYRTPAQAWLENMDTVQAEKLGIVDLHPDVFSVMPRCVDASDASTRDGNEILLSPGGIIGPRGPKSYFYMLPKSERIVGLTTALSVKLMQNYLHIVDTLDIPTDDSQFLEDMAEERNWGLSVLFIDDVDIISENMALALDNVPSFNVMPVYGLNVYSMLKHETLVLTMAALERIEDRLLTHLHSFTRTDDVTRSTAPCFP